MILGDGHIRFGTKSSNRFNHGSIDYTGGNVGGDIHPLVNGINTSRPVYKEGDPLSYDYRIENDSQISTKNQSAYPTSIEQSRHYRTTVY